MDFVSGFQLVWLFSCGFKGWLLHFVFLVYGFLSCCIFVIGNDNMFDFYSSYNISNVIGYSFILGVLWWLSLLRNTFKFNVFIIILIVTLNYFGMRMFGCRTTSFIVVHFECCLWLITIFRSPLLVQWHNLQNYL